MSARSNFRQAIGRCFVILTFVVAVSSQEPSRQPTYDKVILGARVVDGTGNAWFYGDLAIRGDRIDKIAKPGSLRPGDASESIDAEGLVISPGFIDLLSSSDHELLVGSGVSISKITQGITTEILGEGWSDAPVNENTVHGLEPRSPQELDVYQQFDVPHGFGAWLSAMEHHGIATNVGSFLGAMTLRQYVKGMAEGPPTAAEMEQLRQVTRQAMEDGAFGLGSALIYPPGSYATTDELIEIAKAMAPYGGIYATHMRSEADDLFTAVDEAIRIGREGGVSVEIYHLKVAGKRNWPKEEGLIRKINGERARGFDIQANMYPYEAGGTGLSACIPPWAAADGKLLQNLQDTRMRTRIKAQLLNSRPTTEWENLCQLATPDGVVAFGFKQSQNKAYAGKSVAQIAAARRKDWPDALMDILVAEKGQLGAMFFIASEQNVRRQLREPWIKFCTDSSGDDPAHPIEDHPRAYGTFPRILGRYVREQKVLTLEQAVREMTSAVATRLSIKDRGLLREGMYADIVGFDPDTIIDKATYAAPHQLSQGVKFVFVNGQAVVRDGQVTGAKPGRALRGPGYKGQP